MSVKAVQTPNAPAAIGPYSPAVRTGPWLFCSGQIGLDPKTGALVGKGIEEQTRRVLDNIKALLEAQHMTLQQVVKTTVFLTDLADFPAMNAIYATYFSDVFPARSTIQVVALPKGARVEIEAIALNL